MTGDKATREPRTDGGTMDGTAAPPTPDERIGALEEKVAGLKEQAAGLKEQADDLRNLLSMAYKAIGLGGDDPAG